MKTFFYSLLLVSLMSCQRTPAEPTEMKATITTYVTGFTACSSGYLIQMESGAYRSFELPAPYDGDFRKLTYPAPVWIRYQKPTGSCSETDRLIEVTTIRLQ